MTTIANKHCPTKTEMILAHMLSGVAITPLVALQVTGAIRLGAIIFNLRKYGFKVDTYIKETVHGDTYAEYVIPPEWIDHGKGLAFDRGMTVELCC